jgi:hypothetical protein
MLNYIMACGNKCSGTVLYSMLRTRTVPLGSVLTLRLHLYHVFSASHILELTLGLGC